MRSGPILCSLPLVGLAVVALPLAAFAQVSVPAADSPTIQAVRALREGGIPNIARQSTAATTTATPRNTKMPSSSKSAAPKSAASGHNEAPLPIYRPVYPYKTAQGGTPGLPPARTLAEAIKLAYKSSPRLLAARANLRGADYRVPEARAAYGPTLDIQGSWGYTQDRNDTLLGIRTDESGWVTSAAATLSQPILTFGRNRASESSARAQLAYTSDQLHLVENEILLAVVSAYVGVIRDATAVTIARQNAAILGREQEDNTIRYSVREVTATDLEQVQSRFAAAQGALVQAEGQLAISQAQFLREVGAPPGELAQPDVLAVPANTLEAAYAIADVDSPLIRAAQSREKISRAQVEAAKADMMPRVDLRGTAAVGALTPYNDMQRTRRLQAEVVATFHLFDSGLRANKTAESWEANQADWLLIDQALRETRASVAAAWDQMAAARTSLAYYLDAVAASRAAYEGGRVEERAGARTTLEVLDLARDLLFVQTSYNTALANEYLARANLLAAMGRLEAPRLLPDVAAYDPIANRRKFGGTGALPLLTSMMHTLDGLVFGPVHGDRAIRDPGALTQLTAPLPLPADDPALAIDPTQSTTARP